MSDDRKRPGRPPVGPVTRIGYDEPHFSLVAAWAVLFVLLGVVLYGLMVVVALEVVGCG